MVGDTIASLQFVPLANASRHLGRRQPVSLCTSLPHVHYTDFASNRYTQRVINPHTNLTEIQDGLDLLWRNDVDPGKVVLGLGFYGRSFTLRDPSCKLPGCPFTGGAKAGECSGEAGILSNAEIQRIIKKNGLKPTLDTKAGVKWVTWDRNQWVSYDDADTYKMKIDFARKNQLAGYSKSISVLWSGMTED